MKWKSIALYRNWRKQLNSSEDFSFPVDVYFCYIVLSIIYIVFCDSLDTGVHVYVPMLRAMDATEHV